MSEGEIPAAATRRRAVARAGHVGDAAAARTATTDVDASVRATAFAALARLGALEPAELACALHDTDASVRRRAATLAAAATARAEVVSALAALLADPEPLVVESAAWSFGEWGAENPSLDDVLGTLDSIARDHAEALCREAAVAALGAIGDARGLGAILAACGDKSAVRRRAVLALAPFEGDDVEAAIDRALQDRDWQVRQAAEDLRR